MALNLKSLLFVSLFIALVAAPIAEAQILRSRLLQIQGRVFCTINGTMLGNGTAPPPFPNALVQFRCSNLVVAFTITNRTGNFIIIVPFPPNLNLTSLLNSCNLLVNTPLSSCNSSLPSDGRLQSQIQFNGSIILPSINITIVSPVGFVLLPLP